MHRFRLRLARVAGKITGVAAQAERFPWSTCADAGGFLAEQLVGRELQAIAELDPLRHCTHLFDLAILCAAHAHAPAPVVFDLKVADRVDGRTTGTLYENGSAVLQWQLNGTLIAGPGECAGRDLRGLSSWKRELSPRAAMHAMMLRRAIYVSGVRALSGAEPLRATERGPSRLGACYTYQMPQVQDAVRWPTGRIDFSRGEAGPLQGFDPDCTSSAAGDKP